MTTVALVLVLAVPVPEAALAPPLSLSVPFSARLHDSLSVVAWPLSLGSSDATPLAVVAGGFFLLRHDVRLYRSFDRNVGGRSAAARCSISRSISATGS